MIIAPSILTADFLCLGQELQALQNGGIELLHLDIMDGHFVPNLTFGPPVIRQIRKVWKGTIEAHLMVDDPDALLQEYVDAGCDRILIHQEGCWHLHRLLQKIRGLGKEAGVVLNPATPVQSILPVLDIVDLVLLMSVNPGFGGQEYLPLIEAKVQELQKHRSGKSFLIEVDGGIKERHIGPLHELGVDIVVMGSAIFDGGDVSQNLTRIRSNGH